MLGVFSWLFQEVSLRDIKELLLNVDSGALICFVFLSLSTSVFRTWRFLLPLKVNGMHPPRIPLYLIVLVRNLASDLLPARIGSASYIVLVQNQLKIPFSHAATSFSLSFLFDLLALPLVIFIFLLSNSSGSIPNATLALIAVAVGILALIVFLFSLPWIMGKLALFTEEHSRLSTVRKLSAQFKSMAEQFQVAKDSGLFFPLLLLSLAVRAGKYLSLYVFLVGLVIPLGFSLTDFPFSKTLFVLLASEAASSLPISGIAGFGAYEGAWVAVFTTLGFPTDLAALTGFSHHLFTQLYGYSLGFLALFLLLFLPRKYMKHDKLPLQSSTKNSSPPKDESTSLHKSFWYTFPSVLVVVSLTGLVLFRNAFSDIHKTQPMKLPQHALSDPKARQEAASLFGGRKGRILFDSRIGGTFGIYSIAPDGSDLKALVDTEWQEMYPSASPDATRIVYARSRTLQRLAPSEVWIMDLKENKSRLLVKNATFPTFSSDGTKVYFERGRKSVFQIDVSSKKVKKIFPSKASGFKDYEVVKPRLSEDGEKLVFSSDKPDKWNAWVFDLKNKKAQHIFHGCEPIFRGPSDVLWIQTENMKSGTGISSFHLVTKERSVAHDSGPPRGHQYFPVPIPDSSLVLSSECPSDQHDHNSANYEIVVVDTRSGKSAFLTDLGSTSRWASWMGG